MNTMMHAQAQMDVQTDTCVSTCSTSRGQSVEHTLSVLEMLGHPEFPAIFPGHPAQKFVLLAFEGHTNFLTPTASCGRPQAHRKKSGPLESGPPPHKLQGLYTPSHP